MSNPFHTLISDLSGQLSKLPACSAICQARSATGAPDSLQLLAIQSRLERRNCEVIGRLRPNEWVLLVNGVELFLLDRRRQRVDVRRGRRRICLGI